MRADRPEPAAGRSFLDAGGVGAFRRAVEADIGVDPIGIGATRDGGLGFAFPVVILSGVRGRLPVSEAGELE